MQKPENRLPPERRVGLRGVSWLLWFLSVLDWEVLLLFVTCFKPSVLGKTMAFAGKAPVANVASFVLFLKGELTWLVLPPPSFKKKT